MKSSPLLLLGTLLLALQHVQSPGNDETEEVQMVFTDRSKDFLPPKPDPVLFLENVADQKYLPYIIFNDRYVLDLYSFDQHLKNIDFEQNPEFDYYCPKPLFDSLGLRGYYTPMLRTPDIFFCPKLQQSCCVGNDFEELDLLWREKYRNYLQYQQAYFKYYTMTILEQSQAIRRAAQRVVDNAKSELCREIAQKVVETKVGSSLLKTTRKLLERFLDFDYKLKRGFLCLLCDYQNFRNFDFKTKLIDFHHEVCEQIVEHTFDFYNHFNNFVYKYINSANFVAYCYDEMDVHETGRIKRDEPISYLEVDNNQSNEVCAHAHKHGYNIFVNCLSYCSHYDLWYPKRPLYRDIELLGKIFENIKTKIIKSELKYVVETPQAPRNGPIFVSKYDKFNVFDKWEFVFSDQTGVKFDHFVDMDYEDL